VSPQPQRDTTAGRTYNDLRNLARRQGQPTDELFQLYLLERFLFRRAHSPLDRLFVLKGARCSLPTSYAGPPRRTTDGGDQSGTTGRCRRTGLGWDVTTRCRDVGKKVVGAWLRAAIIVVRTARPERCRSARSRRP
jgi:hypothetical protein